MRSNHGRGRLCPESAPAARARTSCGPSRTSESCGSFRDLAAPLLRVVDELLPGVLHDTTQYANNRIEWDDGRLEARLRPMRGLPTDRTAPVAIRGHPFIRNLRRGHYELRLEALHDRLRITAAFDELASAI